jgi:CheY-like chemotaxis protein
MEQLGLRILVVEDNFLEADLIRKALLEAGCTVVGPTARIAEALSLAAEDAIDGALLDIDLKGLKSFATAWELQHRSVPFAFVSGYPRSFVPGPGPLRSVPFLSKPLNEDELVRTVSRFAARAPAAAAAAKARPPRRMKRRQFNI